MPRQRVAAAARLGRTKSWYTATSRLGPDRQRDDSRPIAGKLGRQNLDLRRSGQAGLPAGGKQGDGNRQFDGLRFHRCGSRPALPLCLGDRVADAPNGSARSNGSSDCQRARIVCSSARCRCGHCQAIGSHGERGQLSQRVAAIDAPLRLRRASPRSVSGVVGPTPAPRACRQNRAWPAPAARRYKRRPAWSSLWQPAFGRSARRTGRVGAWDRTGFAAPDSALTGAVQ